MSETEATTISIRLRLPETIATDPEDRIRTVSGEFQNLGDLRSRLANEIAGFDPDDELYNFAVNGAMILHGERTTRLADGDEVELLVAFSGG